MKIFKKNQVVVAVIGIMLIAAGYLNFTNNANGNNLAETGALADSEQMAAIGDAQLVSTQPANDSNLTEKENTTKDNKELAEKNNEENNKNNIIEENKNQEKDTENKKETDNSTQTNAGVTTDEYFTKSRLERDTMYSQMIESYQKILEKTNVSETQRVSAQKEITKINEQKNAIMITENLIKTKGFEDLIIFINDKSINIIIKSKPIKPEQIAQIQNIITRELNAKIEDIHIINKE